MKVRSRSTGAVITDREFRNAHPNTSFPKVLTPPLLDNFGYDPVHEGPQPSGEAWQYAAPAGVEKVGNHWFTKWKLEPTFATQAEQDLYVAQWQEAHAVSPVPRLIASGVFSVADGIVESIGAASGIAMVFPLGVGMYWLFFTEAQPDLSYAAYVSSSSGQINVTSRSTDYLEINVNDGGVPVDPAEFSINIVRSS